MTEHAGARKFVAVVPESAPFSAEQRVQLDKFFNAVFDLSGSQIAAVAAQPTEADETPWHDASLDIDARMAMAVARPLPMRMMAAMAQQDCGQCGYNCREYAKAISEQAEPRLNLCVPGGKTTARMLKSLVEEMGGGVLDPDEKAAADAAASAAPPKGDAGVPGRSRATPVEAIFVSRRRLNGIGSEKVTNHIELDLTSSGLDYAVGDSLGMFPSNDPALVDAILSELGYPADFPIAGKPLRDVLIHETSLGSPPDSLFQLISYLVGGERRKKAQALAKGQDPDGDAATLDVLAALEKFRGIRPDPEALMEVLEPLQPRLYSISSSIKANPGRVSLTVDTVRYDSNERVRLGVASTFLDDRIEPGSVVRVYVQKAHGFALPADPATPIIMVGPGTGVAPFRAFLHERAAVKALGKCWLFFGHQREASDYFYKDELAALSDSGTLTRLSLAWSRDGGKKTYVQDLMREESAELFQWLNEGAHFYICGDAKRMAKDVEGALVEIAMQHGKMDKMSATAFVKKLKSDNRYQADVY